jgi:HEAT repeat protein
VEVLQALAARRTAAALPAVFRSTASHDPGVRRAAMNALAALADRNTIPGLVTLLANAREETERKTAAEAIAQAVPRVPDKQFCADTLLQGLAGASAPAACQLLSLLPLAPVPSALSGLQKAAAGDDATVRSAAVRALAGWPHPAALEALLPIARTGDETQRVLAVRGCVRLLRLQSERPVDDTLALYGALLDAAQRADEKRMVLAALPETGSAGALKLIQPFLDHPELSEEAGIAAVKIARAIAPSDPELAKQTLETVARPGRSGPAADQAREALGHP